MKTQDVYKGCPSSLPSQGSRNCSTGNNLDSYNLSDLCRNIATEILANLSSAANKRSDCQCRVHNFHCSSGCISHKCRSAKGFSCLDSCKPLKQCGCCSNRSTPSCNSKIATSTCCDLPAETSYKSQCSSPSENYKKQIIEAVCKALQGMNLSSFSNCGSSCNQRRVDCVTVPISEENEKNSFCSNGLAEKKNLEPRNGLVHKHTNKRCPACHKTQKSEVAACPTHVCPPGELNGVLKHTNLNGLLKNALCGLLNSTVTSHACCISPNKRTKCFETTDCTPLDSPSIKNMSVKQLKISLAKLGVVFNHCRSKDELAHLLKCKLNQPQEESTAEVNLQVEPALPLDEACEELEASAPTLEDEDTSERSSNALPILPAGELSSEQTPASSLPGVTMAGDDVAPLDSSPLSKNTCLDFPIVPTTLKCSACNRVFNPGSEKQKVKLSCGHFIHEKCARTFPTNINCSLCRNTEKTPELGVD
jgi:hypothetical protein